MSKKSKSNQEAAAKGESLGSALESENITPAERSQSQEGPSEESHPKNGEPINPSSGEDDNKNPSDSEVPASSSPSNPETQAAPKPNETSAPKQSGKKSGAMVSVLIICLLVTIAVAGGFGYFAWQEIQKERQKIVELDERLDKHSQQLVKANQAVISIEEKVQDQTQIFTAYNQQSDELEAKLNTQLQAYREQLLTLSTTSNDDWKLAEAYYLTRLAVQRLQMEKSTLDALALLQSADDIIKAQKDPELYRVREVLAADITTLQLAGAIDREGIYLQLSSIIKQLDSIPSLIPENFQNISSESNTSSNPVPEVSNSVIENSFNNFVKHLQSYFRVQHADNKIDISLSVQDNDLAKTRLILLLESAQLALLREHSEIYTNSLAKAQEILATYFPEDGPKQATLATEKLLKLIEEIQGETILQTLPSIHGSQKILGEYLERLHKIKTVEAIRVEPGLPLEEEVNVPSPDMPVLTEQQETVVQ